MTSIFTKSPLLALILSPALATAAEQANVKVSGMVCSFCAQGIKKKFSSEKAVSKIDVNLDDKWVKVDFKEGETLNDDKIKDLIKNAGYDVVSIERSQIK